MLPRGVLSLEPQFTDLATGKQSFRLFISVCRDCPQVDWGTRGLLAGLVFRTLSTTKLLQLGSNSQALKLPKGTPTGDGSFVVSQTCLAPSQFWCNVCVCVGDSHLGNVGDARSHTKSNRTALWKCVHLNQPHCSLLIGGVPGISGESSLLEGNQFSILCVCCCF